MKKTNLKFKLALIFASFILFTGLVIQNQTFAQGENAPLKEVALKEHVIEEITLKLQDEFAQKETEEKIETLSENQTQKQGKTQNNEIKEDK